MSADLAPKVLLQILKRRGGSARRKWLIKEFQQRWEKAIGVLIDNLLVEFRDCEGCYQVTPEGWHAS